MNKSHLLEDLLASFMQAVNEVQGEEPTGPSCPECREEQLEELRKIGKKTLIDSGVTIAGLATSTEDCTAAELKQVLNQVKDLALKMVIIANRL